MKDAYYFSHDSNARNDQRLMKVRMKYGPEGYGIYFMVIEILRDTENYKLHISDVNSICFDIRSKEENVLDILKNYNLFEFEDDFFYSKSLSRRMEKLDKIKEIRRESGKKGAKATAKVRQVLKSETANVEQVEQSKEKKSKAKDSKENKISIRAGKFKEQVLEFQSKYDLDMLEEFISYWTEPNKSKTKLKYQMEATWDLSRRLTRWSSTNFQSNKPINQNGKVDEATSGRYQNLAEQSKRFRSYMAQAEDTAADPVDIKQILGQTLAKLKPESVDDEEGDGQ